MNDAMTVETRRCEAGAAAHAGPRDEGYNHYRQGDYRAALKKFDFLTDVDQAKRYIGLDRKSDE